MGKPLHTSEWKTVVRAKPELDGYRWTVMRFDKVVAQGEADTHEKAEKAADKVLVQLVIAPAKQAGKRYQLSQLMQQYRRGRPNLVLYVFQCLAQAEDMRSRDDCVRVAEDEEQRIANVTQEGWRVPVPTHGRSLPAQEIAGRIWDAAVAAGCVGAKAMKKAEAMFGYWWHDQSAEPGVWTKTDGVWEVRTLRHLEEVYTEMMKKNGPSKPKKAAHS